MCETNATGILVFESNGVTVENNSLATNQVGIFIGGQNSTVISNAVSNSVTLIGIAFVGDDNSARDNTLFHSDQAGIYVQGNGYAVTGNEITDAAVGVLKISGSSGNTITGNRFFATLITVQDPGPARAIAVSPIR